MFYPNLLEYHLLSSCPPVDSSPSVSLLQRRFAYALRYLSYPKYFYSVRCLFIHRCFSVTSLCFTRFSLPYRPIIFPSKVSACCIRNFHFGATAFQPEDKFIVQQLHTLIYKDCVSKMYRKKPSFKTGRILPIISVIVVNYLLHLNFTMPLAYL